MPPRLGGDIQRRRAVEIARIDIRAVLVKQVVSSVLWEDCMRSASAAGATTYLELGPGGVLAGLARRTNKDWPVKSVSEFSDLAA